MVIFLFDIDGVLVQPFGYRHAMRSTLAVYFQRMGLPSSFLPKEDEIGFFEAHRITSEWDMLPICLAAVFNQALKPGSPPLDTVPDAINWIKTHQPALTRPDYRQIIADCARLHTHQDALAHRLLAALGSHERSQPFNNLSRQPFIHALLGNTRNFEVNEVSRTFQNHVLGEPIFGRIYPHLPSLPLPSSLETLDRPQIDEVDQSKIFALVQAGKIQAAAMTLRPNLYPDDHSNGQHNMAGFSPEAEIAMRLTRLDCLPVAGYGTLLYLAQKHRLSIDQLIKPSPLHALAGIFLALKNSPQSLDQAFDCYHHARQPDQQTAPQPVRYPDLPPGEQLQLHVFEDSPNGIQSALAAAQILRTQQIRVELRAWGISTHADKRNALQNLGATVTTSTEEALRQAFQQVAH